MQYINNTIAVSITELMQIFPKRTIHSWELDVVKKGGGYDNITWYDFNSLPERKKEIVEKVLPKPVEPTKPNSYFEKVVADPKAEAYYNEYMLADGRFLPADKRREYSNNAAVLNMIKEELTGCIEERAKKGKKPVKFWSGCAAHINLFRDDKEKGHTLPENERKLQLVFEYYIGAKKKSVGKEDNQRFVIGYESLISGKWCNDNSRKVDEASDLFVLLKLIAHPNAFDNFAIATKYNTEYALPNNRETITASTVFNYRDEYAMEIEGLLKGAKVAYGKYVPVTRRKAPSAPLLFVGSDDVHIDWYFKMKGIDGEKANNFVRPKLIVVMDMHKRYILGYACGMQTNVDLVKAAYLNALHHIKELTGEFYSFQQIQYDRFGMKPLAEMYAAVSKFDFEKERRDPKSAHPRSRAIESLFSSEMHSILKQNPHGYSGHNWGAKTKANAEYLQMDMKNYPGFEDMPFYVHALITEMRNSKPAGCEYTKKELWLHSWREMDESKRIPLSDMNRLLSFGIKHADAKSQLPESYTLKNDVWMPKIAGVQHEYSFVDERQYINNFGLKFNILYDPYDLSTVLAVNEDGTRQMLMRETERVPMAAADHTEGTRALLNFRLSKRNSIINHMKDASAMIQNADFDLEGNMRIGMDKKLQQAAEDMRLIRNESFENTSYKGIEEAGEIIDPVFIGNGATYEFEDDDDNY